MIALIKPFLTRPRLSSLFKKLIKFTFQLLILLLPSQLALHFWPTWAYVYGFRIDYFSPTLHLTDVLTIILLGLWLFESLLLKGKKKCSKRLKYQYLTVVFVSVVLMGVNTYLAISPWLAAYRWVKVIEFILIGVFVARKKEFDFKDWIAKPLVFSLLAVTMIAFIQFNFQKTVGGLLYLVGERSFTAITPGISTFTLFGRELLRPYSVFPHPNAMAGYLGVGIFLLLFDIKNTNRKTFWSKLALIFSFSALILSVSHGAWIAAVLISIIFLIEKLNKNTFRRVCVSMVLLIIVLSLLLPAVSRRLGSTLGHIEVVSHRLRLSQVSGEMIAKNVFSGLGNGNFILGLKESVSFPKESWWLQPVHNIFLLTFSELGFIGFIIFVTLLLVGINKTILKNDKKLLAVILFIILTGSLDHYWLTLQQTQMLFAIIIGLMFRKKKG